MAGRDSEYYQYTKENEEALRLVIGGLVKAKKYQHKYFWSKCSIDTAVFSKWINNGVNRRPLTARQYYRLIADGFEEGWLEDELLFKRGLCAFLGIKHSNLPSVQRAVGGHYTVYRFSYLKPGMILKGHLHIDEKTLVTKEKYRIQAALQPNSHKGERAKDSWFPRTGVFLPRGQNTFVMISKKDDRNQQVQTTYLEPFGVGNSFMRGKFSDWHGSVFYAGRMYLQKISGEMDEGNILTLSPNKVDVDIVQYLQSQIVSVNNIVTMPDSL